MAENSFMETNRRRPNFLIFVADQIQSYSLGCNGNKDVKTPNIDKLAGAGCTFQRAYCNNPVCMPSRSTMLTGLKPRQHGCVLNGYKLPEKIPTVAEILARHGYHTHAVGKLHFQPFFHHYTHDPVGKRVFSWEDLHRWRSGEITKLPEMYYGFKTADFIGGHVDYCFGEYESWLNENHPGVCQMYLKENAYFKDQFVKECWSIDIPVELHYNHWIADKCNQFIDNLTDEDNFFLWCSFPDPHHPFVSCKPYSEMYDPHDLTLNPTNSYKTDDLDYLAALRKKWGQVFKNENGLRNCIAQAYGMISHVDDNIGRVLAHLEQRGLADNTVVVVMADHGEYLGSHGLLYKNSWPWEELLRIPFIWKVPDAFATGVKSQSIVSLLDFVPTILHYADINQEEMRYRNKYELHHMNLPGQSLKKFLSEGKSLDRNIAVNEYDNVTTPASRARTIIEEQYKMTIYGDIGEGILTDLKNDPYETTNLWNNEDYADIKAKLTEKLMLELIRTARMDEPRICGA